MPSKLTFSRETVTLLRDDCGYIRAIVYYDSLWYAVAPLGVPEVKPMEFSGSLKRHVKGWAKAVVVGMEKKHA
jgi:hypothetical protein